MNLAEIKRQFKELPLDVIDEPAHPSRSAMDDEKMDELVGSIRAHGLLQPMIVARHGSRYEVVAGHRRRIACGRAGLVAAPCVVYPSRGDALEAIKYAENRHREELSAADEAIWFAELLERDCGGDVDRLCAQIGERRGYVEGRLLLLGGDDRVFAALQEQRIGVGVAQQLNRCPDQAHRRMLLDDVIRNGATRAIVAGWIDEYFNLHQHVSGQAAPNATDPTIPTVPDSQYFTCYVCRGTDHVGNMRPLQVHDYCIPARLDPALALERDRSAYVRAPRSLEEAIELLNDLVDRWPGLTGQATGPR